MNSKDLNEMLDRFKKAVFSTEEFTSQQLRDLSQYIRDTGQGLTHKENTKAKNNIILLVELMEQTKSEYTRSSLRMGSLPMRGCSGDHVFKAI